MVKSVLDPSSPYCRECFAQQHPVKNDKIANKKRMLCKYHYKRFYVENQCKEEGCKRLAKDGEGRCTRHTEEHEESRCVTPGCATPRKKRASYCDTCYMRHWRLSKRQGYAKENDIRVEEGEDSDDRREVSPSSSSESESPTIKIKMKEKENTFREVSGKKKGVKSSFGEIVSPTTPEKGIWLCGETLFLCGSELGTNGHRSVSVHFLQRTISGFQNTGFSDAKRGKRRMFRKHVFTERYGKEKRRKFSLDNKSSPSPPSLRQYGVCI